MDISMTLRILGGLIILVGFVLVANPEWVTQKPVPSDVFEAVERRIWWGLIIGVGIVLMFHHQLFPLSATIAATLSSLLIGMLIARLVGIALDGSVLKQWLYVGVEIVILMPLIWWYWRASH